ncbi:MAG TPA: Gfo/Idh/MocA family oxidoreductase [Terriglobales bacterium]|nr:Gfo/Idh/MocA family oxidoreductase [Terriglobales bacterium]
MTVSISMVKFGIVGFGLHAVKRLMPGFALAKNSRVVALSKRNADEARDAARQFQIPLAFPTAEELCRSSEVDAVFVATPNACHLHDVLVAIECRKPVLCEKPMAINAEECARMVEAARRESVLLGVAQVFRFEESTLLLRERIAAGQIGKVIFARAEFSFPGGSGHPRKWLNNLVTAGGGPIADVGVHCIDALRFILRDEVARVTARGFSDQTSGDVEAAAALILEFSRGTLGTITVSFRADYRTPLEFVGQSGVFRADNGLNVERPINIELRRGWDVVETETVSNREAYARQVDSFAAAIEGKQQFPAPGEEGWKNQEILDAAYRSMKSGKAEEVRRVVREA